MRRTRSPKSYVQMNSDSDNNRTDVAKRDFLSLGINLTLYQIWDIKEYQDVNNFLI